MKDYVRFLLLLLTVCSVSSFRIYFPGESKHDDGDDTVSFIAGSMTALCAKLCVERLNKNPRDCQAWCQLTPTPLAVASSTSLELMQQQGNLRQQLQQQQQRQQQQKEQQLEGGGNRGGVVASKRQVDPLLSCIEARCAGLVHSRYGSCIYSKCIASWKKRSSVNSYSPITGSNQKRTPAGPWQDGGGAGDDEGLGGGAGDGGGDIDDDDFDGQQEDWIDLHLQTLPQMTSKRSWNDVMHTCIEYNCGGSPPGSFEYHICIQQSCSKHMFGRRR